jgi:outer membrane lipoprotein
MFRGTCAYRLCLACLAWLFLVSLSGCTHTFSKEFRQQVSAPIPFQELLEQAEVYKGERVILGGYVLEVSNERDGTFLKILQAPLDSQEKPKSRDLSEGRFLVRTQKFLDPEIYSQDRGVSIGGKVAGVQTQPLGKGTYRYPVIEAEELHLWPKQQPGARYDYPYYWYPPWYFYPYHPHPWRWHRSWYPSPFCPCP